jgi:hypothetical protein
MHFEIWFSILKTLNKLDEVLVNSWQQSSIKPSVGGEINTKVINYSNSGKNIKDLRTWKICKCQR